MATATISKGPPLPPTRIERVALTQLKAATYNPRKITERAAAGLGYSIDRFGLVQPIVWNVRSSNVVGGHQRLKHIRKRGAKEVDVVVVDLDESDEKALNIALNSPSLAGEFDERLAGILDELQTRDDDLFESLRFDDLLESAESARARTTREVSFVADADPKPPTFGVIVEARDLAQQDELLARFAAEGFVVKALA